MIRFRKIVMFLLFWFAGFNLYAQQGSAIAILSADSLIIGEQLKYSIRFSGDKPTDVVFPTFNETLAKGIYIVKQDDIQQSKDGSQPLFYRDYLITVFDTGLFTVPSVKLDVIYGNDTIGLFTDSLQIKVKPYLSVDTVPRDTIRAEKGGIIIFGRNNFDNEIAQSIPDSVAKSMSKEQLKIAQDSIRDILTQQFSSELFRAIGFRNDEAVNIISAGSEKTFFILNNNTIVETHRIPGANDTVFINEYDTVHQGQPLYVTIQIKDITDEMYNTPQTWAEFWWRLVMFLKHNWWWIAISVIVIAIALYYFIFRKKGIKNLFRRIPPPEPPHVVALRELDRIKNEKIWQVGKTKEFYTELTDVLRKYLEGRFGVFAMEMTSDEIINAMSEVAEINYNVLPLLKQILFTADSVKFAKAEPMQHENDLFLKNAFTIVESTAEVPQSDTGILEQAYIEVEPEKQEGNKDV